MPDGEFTDSQLAIFITRLETAGEDCRGQLAEVKNVLEVQGATITDTLVTAEKVKPWWKF